jgi:hypothetical protein
MNDMVKITVEGNHININNEAKVDIACVKQITYNRSEIYGIVSVDFGSEVIDYKISLKAAYVLIMLIPPSSWVNI